MKGLNVRSLLYFMLIILKKTDTKINEIEEYLEKCYFNQASHEELRQQLQAWGEDNQIDCCIAHFNIIERLITSISPNMKFKKVSSDMVDSENIMKIIRYQYEQRKEDIFDMINIEYNLYGVKEESVIVTVHGLINEAIRLDEIDESYITTSIGFLALGANLCAKTNNLEYFTRAMLLPYIIHLYQRNYTQKSRNIAETFYLYLVSKKRVDLAFFIHAEVYSHQKAPFMTVINLVFMMINTNKEKVSDEYYLELILIYFRFLREINNYEKIITFYENKILISGDENLILSTSLIYVHSLFYTDIFKASEKTLSILGKYEKKIIENGAVEAWLANIFNIIKNVMYLEPKFENYLEVFKSSLGEKRYYNVYSKFFSNEKSFSELMKVVPLISNVLYEKDLRFDIQEHIITAKNSLDLINESKNFDNIYLVLFFLLSPEFTREVSLRDTRRTDATYVEKEGSFFIKNFKLRLHDYSKKYNGIIMILFSSQRETYLLSVNNDDKKLHSLKWESRQCYDWINKNSKKLEIIERSEYELFEKGMSSEQIKIIEALEDNIIDSSFLDEGSHPIIIFRSFEHSYYPHNFYKDNKSLYISLKKPISLCFSMKKDSLTQYYLNDEIEIWAPCEAGDYAINILCSRIEDFNKDNYVKSFIYKESILSKKLSNDIALIITHGGSNIDETKRVYFGSDERQIELSNLIEKNKFIILFVCHSGKQSLGNFSYHIDSIITKLLQNKTHAIVAPSWPLSIDVAFYYYKQFLSRIYSKKSFAEIHHEIMVEMNKCNKNPSIWGNLHYYGNPNICIN